MVIKIDVLKKYIFPYGEYIFNKLTLFVLYKWVASGGYSLFKDFII